MKKIWEKLKQGSKLMAGIKAAATGIVVGTGTLAALGISSLGIGVGVMAAIATAVGSVVGLVAGFATGSTPSEDTNAVKENPVVSAPQAYTPKPAEPKLSNVVNLQRTFTRSAANQNNFTLEGNPQDGYTVRLPGNKAA